MTLNSKKLKADALSLINSWIEIKNHDYQFDEPTNDWAKADNEFNDIINYYGERQELDDLVFYLMSGVLDDKQHLLLDYDENTKSITTLLHDDICYALEDSTFEINKKALTHQILAIPYFGRQESLEDILSLDGLETSIADSGFSPPGSTSVVLGAVPVELAQFNILSMQSLFNARKSIVEYFLSPSSENLEKIKPHLGLDYEFTDHHINQDGNKKVVGQYLILFANQIDESIAHPNAELYPLEDFYERWDDLIKEKLEYKLKSRKKESFDEVEDIMLGFESLSLFSSSLSSAMASWIVSQLALQEAMVNMGNEDMDGFHIKHLKVQIPDDTDGVSAEDIAVIYGYDKNNEMIGQVQVNALCLLIQFEDIFEFIEQSFENDISIEAYHESKDTSFKKRKRMLN